jgi:hypothetical protein
MKHTRRKSRSGTLQRFFPLEDTSPLLGIGGYGIVFQHHSTAIKLLHELDKCTELLHEAKIQKKARRSLKSIVKVPAIRDFSTYPVRFKETLYLCGIAMEAVPVLPEFNEQIHMIFGLEDTSNLDESWGQTTSLPVTDTNPSRGFFASPELLEDLWKERNSKWTIDLACFTMGSALRTLLDAGILPDDVEWIYGNDDEIWLLDFGLCTFGSMNPFKYLHAKGLTGLASDIYVPHTGQRGYESFLEGFTRQPVSRAQIEQASPTA